MRSDAETRKWERKNAKEHTREQMQERKRAQQSAKERFPFLQLPPFPPPPNLGAKLMQGVASRSLLNRNKTQLVHFLTHKHACAHACTRTNYTHTHTDTHRHTQTHWHNDILTHTHTHRHTHTHTHIDGRKRTFQKRTRACRNARFKNASMSKKCRRVFQALLDSVSVRYKNARLKHIRVQWNAGTACVSECVLKTLACRGLRVGPSKHTCTHARRNTHARMHARTLFWIAGPKLQVGAKLQWWIPKTLTATDSKQVTPNHDAMPAAKSFCVIVLLQCKDVQQEVVQIFLSSFTIDKYSFLFETSKNNMECWSSNYPSMSLTLQLDMCKQNLCTCDRTYIHTHGVCIWPAHKTYFLSTSWPPRTSGFLPACR